MWEKEFDKKFEKEIEGRDKWLFIEAHNVKAFIRTLLEEERKNTKLEIEATAMAIKSSEQSRIKPVLDVLRQIGGLIENGKMLGMFESKKFGGDEVALFNLTAHALSEVMPEKIKSVAEDRKK